MKPPQSSALIINPILPFLIDLPFYVVTSDFGQPPILLPNTNFSGLYNNVSGNFHSFYNMGDWNSTYEQDLSQLTSVKFVEAGFENFVFLFESIDITGETIFRVSPIY